MAMTASATRCFPTPPAASTMRAGFKLVATKEHDEFGKATIVAVSFLPASNGVERGRDESTRRARAPGAALVRQAQDRSRDHPRSIAPTGRIPRASSAAAAKGYAGDTR